MTINGLENNYYLTQNDIWISVGGFTNDTSYLELTIKNITSNLDLPILKLYPSPSNDFQFNINQTIRALFPEPNHITINSLQSFQIDFVAKFIDPEIPDESESLLKFWVRGGRNKNGNDEWYLSASEELIVGKWIEWNGIDLPGFAKRIQGSSIVDFIPSNPFRKNIPNNCDYRIIKFLNSLGGYQYYVFEKHEKKPKSKAGKTISKISNRLRKDNFMNLGIKIETNIEFKTKTPFEIQDVITDLISSFEVFIYNPLGSDNDAKWERLQLENNDSVENNFDRIYDNKIEFSFPNYRTIGL